MRCAVIFGHQGQDGRLLSEQLAAAGFAIVGVGRSGITTSGLEWKRPASIDDPESLQALFTHVRPVHVYYLAAHHHSSQDAVADERATWERSLEVHVEGFANVLDAARKAQPHPRVFYASSSRIFGIVESAVQTEASRRRPVCLYGVTKAAGMMVADYQRTAHGLHVSTGILYNHESPLRRREFLSQRVVYGLLEASLGRRSTLPIGDLSARVDWGYAPDYTRAMRMILDHDEAGDFIVATGETRSVRDLLDVAARHIGIDWTRYVVEDKAVLARPSLPACGSPDKLRRATGWEPRTSFDQMVRILIDAAREQVEKAAK